MIGSRHPSPDIQRLVGDIVRLGTIASVDHGSARCTVAVGDLTTGGIPWLTHRAGATACWSPPTIGEQVMLICPEGDTAAGVALRGIYSNANPAPAAAAELELIRFSDGSTASYDAAAHHLEMALADGATARLTVPGGLTIVGPVSIDGGLTVSADVTAGGTSLRGHVHGQVKAGTDRSGAPA